MPATRADYRERFYSRYVDSHMRRLRDMTAAGIRNDFPVLRKTVAPFLPRNRNADILDLGCGFGTLVAFLHQLGYVNARGIDGSPEMVRVAARLGISGITEGDIVDHLETAAGSYDMIIALDVVEHFKKDELLRLLEMIHHALRPHGTFLLQTPNGLSHYGRWYGVLDFTHEIILDEESTQQCLNVAGFENVAVRPVPPVVHGIASAIRASFWFFWQAFLKLSLAVEAGWVPGQVFTPNLIAVATKGSLRERS